MIPKNINKPTRFANCQVGINENKVQSGLALTPSQMYTLAQQGKPISANILPDDNFDDGQPHCTYELPLDQQRGIDVTDMWNASKIYLKNSTTSKTKITKMAKNKNLIAPIVAAGAGLAGNVANVYMQNQTNKANQEIATRNNQHNQNMWQQTNEYNTPANQMHRLKEAGLNTSMLYGQPSNTAQPQQQADTSNKAQSPKVDFDNAISNTLQASLLASQTANIQEDTKSKQIQNQLSEKRLPYESQNQEYHNQNLSITVEKAETDLRLQRSIQNQFDQLNPTVIKQAQAQFDLTEQQAINASIQAQILIQDLSEKSTRYQLFQDLTQEQIERARAENKVLGIDANNYETIMGSKDNPTGVKPVLFWIKTILGILRK